jgi:ketosteroid isomerase-like protein
MPTEVSNESRTTEWLRLFDAKDVDGLWVIVATDFQGADEVTRSWVRDRPAMEAYLRDLLPRISELHSTITDLDVRRWGDIQVETGMMHQTGALVDGTKVEQDAPMTTIWRREGETWRLALIHSVALAQER